MGATVSLTKYIKLEQRLHLMTRLASSLAETLKDATASDEQRGYDRSRTFCDVQEDHDFAITAIRITGPTLRALDKKHLPHAQNNSHQAEC